MNKQVSVLIILSIALGIFTIDGYCQNGNDPIQFQWKEFQELSKAVTDIDNTFTTLRKAIEELQSKVSEEQIPSGITASITLLEQQITLLKSALNNYDSQQQATFKKKQNDLSKQIETLQKQVEEWKPAAESKDEAVKIIVSKIEELDNLVKATKTIKDLRQKNVDLQTKNENLAKELKDFDNRIGNLPSKDDVGNVVSKKLKESLEKKNWGFGIGFFINYPERAQEKEYFVNADSFLVAENGKATVGLNLAALIYYKLGRNFTFQTSIPILRFLDPTGAPTSFFQPVSGAVGIGYRSKEEHNYWITAMVNFGEIKVLRSGAESLYISKGDFQNVLKFPGPNGANIDPDSKDFESFFDADVQVSFSVGISFKT